MTKAYVIIRKCPVQIKIMFQHMSLRKLNRFFIYYHIKHITDIPQNSARQVVIERPN